MVADGRQDVQQRSACRWPRGGLLGVSEMARDRDRGRAFGGMNDRDMAMSRVSVLAGAPGIHILRVALTKVTLPGGDASAGATDEIIGRGCR